LEFLRVDAARDVGGKHQQQIDLFRCRSRPWHRDSERQQGQCNDLKAPEHAALSRHHGRWR
jgi:hypothetical protein